MILAAKTCTLILDFILKKTFVNKEIAHLSLMKLHPALKYYTLSQLAFIGKSKPFMLMSTTTRLLVKTLMPKITRFASKLTHGTAAVTVSRWGTNNKPRERQKPFIHHFFNTNKVSFNQNTIPLIGGIPSYYLSDIKPIKTWKFSNVFLKSGDVEPAHIKLRPRTTKLRPADFKQTVCKKIRLRLMRSLLNKNIKAPTATQNILNFKSLTKRLSKFKPMLKWVPAPVYITKWKTSYPLMFTNNMHANKLLKPQTDLTIKTFIQSRNNRRVRRFKKILFRKLKKNSRDKKSIKSASSHTRNSKRDLLTAFFRNRLKNHPNSLVSSIPNTAPIRKQHKTLRKDGINLHSTSIQKYEQTFTQTNYPVTWDATRHNQTRARRLLVKSRVKLSKNIKKSSTKLLQIKYKFYGLDQKASANPQLPTAVLKTDLPFHMSSRTDKNFIFKNFGIFLTSFIFLNQKKPFTYKYLFKKKIFSFLYPNEVRNSLMARKKKIVFYQLIYKIKHKSKQKAYYSFNAFNKSFINHYKTSLQNASNAPITQELFGTNTTSSQNTLNLTNYVSSRDEILYNQNFSYRGVDLSFKRSEVKIPRVRFRPGYQRMWRNARNALKESMGLKFVYQQQLTRCLVRFYKNSNKYSFARSEMSVNRIIMYSRLLPDNPTVGLFIDQKLIYLNGRLLHTQQTILVPNDLVQLIVSIWYYVVYRWISNWTLKRHKKFKKLVYRKGLAGKHKVMKLKKQRSYYTPNWIYLARYDISDVKPFLEVDYFTLSAFVLYEPFMTYYCTPDESPDFRPNIYRMYNWKYIT